MARVLALQQMPAENEASVICMSFNLSTFGVDTI